MIKPSGSNGGRIEGLCHQDLVMMSQRIQLESLVLLIVDEVSMLTPKLLSTIDARLQQATGVKKPFGDISVLLTGDFMQIPPVAGLPLYVNSLNVAKYESDGTVASKCSERDIRPGGVCHAGAKLFNSFFRTELTEQQRASGDENHTALVQGMSAGMQLTPRSLQHFKRLSAEDVQEDPARNFAAVLVTSNRERIDNNKVQLERFAVVHGECIIRWRTDRDWENAPDLIVFPEAEEEPALWTYLEYHSLSFDSDEQLLELQVGEEEAKTPGSFVTLSSPPASINVRLYPKNKLKRRNWSYPTVVAGDAIVPILPNRRFPTVSNIVIPPSPYYKATKVKVQQYLHVDMLFSMTYNKAQGQRIQKVIVSANERPSGLASVSYQGLFVAYHACGMAMTSGFWATAASTTLAVYQCQGTFFAGGRDSAILSMGYGTLGYCSQKLPVLRNTATKFP